MAFFSEFFRSSTAHPWISALRGATDWALYRYSSLLSWQATFRDADQALDYQFLESPCMHAEDTLRQSNMGVARFARLTSIRLTSSVAKEAKIEQCAKNLPIMRKASSFRERSRASCIFMLHELELETCRPW